MLRTFISRYLAVILLSGIATHKAYLSHADGLTRWRGGGFGMYSEIHWKERLVWIGSKNREFKLDINKLHNDPLFKKLRDQTKRNPNQENLSKLSKKIASFSNKKPFYVQVWRGKFDLRTSSYTRKLISEHKHV